GGAEVWWAARLFGTVDGLRSRSTGRQTDLQLHLADMNHVARLVGHQISPDEQEDVTPGILTQCPLICI
ncbi:hypothetical protein PIB30_116052, partial [Stylosanthes scabra]|nr:hypothetical protein [Stylosanthes scabra]